MSKQEEAGLILKLYELRREDTMRKARDWYFGQFHPESMSDYNDALFGPYSGFMRMVISYWDMAAALVNNGAISSGDVQRDQRRTHRSFCKVEPFLAELRTQWGPQYLANLEKLIDATPNGRQRVAANRDRAKAMTWQTGGLISFWKGGSADVVFNGNGRAERRGKFL